ncbi:hypothetical protein [Paraburkholderia susongensis]|uniref:Uncharacterized protein n=1 Tax=Paraburkholderia susongensis TaxID=1515439 RepID=A0A1X7K930_9BURK|nr:hypothetical protein [Paraburkholderia susongensis]SMG37214.1 hypothetical protein SAMN06265784_103472 [Paraburkholderia susongensis]
MLYLKNTLGGLSRSLTDSAHKSFQGPHRWWKLALLAGLIVLPGGSVGVALLAWVEHRRGTKRAKSKTAGAQTGTIALPTETSTPMANTIAAPAANATTACQTRGDAPCRAAAGKLARQRQTKPAEPRS